MASEKEYIIIRESLLQALLSDLATVLTFAAMIGLGVYLDSAAMEWIGALLFFIVLCSRVMNQKTTRFTSVAKLKAWAAEL